ncbi:MAG: LysM domain-containing protein [Oscillospiraceae bacterium]|nr:LysM domain-containing protein [Oscillospiraceae bacterium]
MYCFQEIEYAVRQGDTLFRLAEDYQTTVPALIALNPGIDPYNLVVGSVIRICPGETRSMTDGEAMNVPADCEKRMILKDQMRLAWSQHVYWTRLLLISLAHRLNDTTETTNRVLRNPKDIANIYAQYYSPEAAAKLENIITEHLKIGSALIVALRDGNTEEADRLTHEWYINAGAMADAFVDINPYYNHSQMHEMFYTHLDLTTEEVLARLANDFQADIEAFDKVEREAMMMADYLALGIIEQFPQMFA